MNSTKSFVRMSIYALPTEFGRHCEAFLDWTGSPVVDPGSIRLGEPTLRRNSFDPVHIVQCTDSKEDRRSR
jgi:hypothetical protein